MNLSAETEIKLEHVCNRLHHEYPDLPSEIVEEVVDRAANSLLTRARFDQFVPLLAQRAARERLAAANN